MANIAIGKIGKSIMFDRSKWSHIGGTFEPPNFAYMMAKTYPQHTFYMISPSDYHILFPKGLLPNLISLWAPEYWENGLNPRYFLDTPWDEDPDYHRKYYDYCIDTFKRLNVDIDFAFIHLGMLFGCCMFGLTPNKDKTRYIRAMYRAETHGAPIVNWINHYKGKYAWVVGDVRMFNTQCSDYANIPPSVSLSQWNNTTSFTKCTGRNGKFITCYDEEGSHIIENNFPQVYSGFETLVLVDKNPIPLEEDFSIRKGFSVLCNYDINQPAANTGYPIGKDAKTTPRYELLKRYILNDKHFDCSIYGEWPERFTNGDKRFKGPLEPARLQQAYRQFKYTLVFGVPGLVTSKFLEACHFGVIPFCVDTYASLADCTYIPKFLIVHDAKEMHSKAEFLDNNSEAYIKLRKYFKNFLDTEGYNGKYFLEKQAKLLNQYANFDLGPMQLSERPLEELFQEDKKRIYTNFDIDDLF